jgi:hypothetical protein
MNISYFIILFPSHFTVVHVGFNCLSIYMNTKLYSPIDSYSTLNARLLGIAQVLEKVLAKVDTNSGY